MPAIRFDLIALRADLSFMPEGHQGVHARGAAGVRGPGGGPGDAARSYGVSGVIGRTILAGRAGGSR